MIAGTCEFNRILALALALICGAGCQSDQAKKYTKNDQASLRLYLEVNRDGTDQNEPELIGREHAFAVNVERRAFLTEFNIEKASIVEAMGGFSISVQFNK